MLVRLRRWAYRRQLNSLLDGEKLPHHVGLILDGNRRFARKSRLPSVGDGHQAGADKAESFVQWCDEIPIPIVSVWVLSIDNLGRDADELERIFSIVETTVATLAASGAATRRRRIRAVGRLNLLPVTTQEAIRRAESDTSEFGPYQLALAVAYGGREEIADAVQRLIAGRIDRGASLESIASAVSTEEISQYLYAPDLPDPDLIIRTSGEIRHSGFQLWRSVYSEYFFSTVYWPEFQRLHFIRALRSFGRRERRMGR